MTQRYLVLHELANGMCGLSIETAGNVYTLRMECWTIRTPEQVKFVHMGMARLLRSYHVSGRYEQMATYAMNFDEMYQLIVGQMGPCDRIRCLQLQSEPSVDWDEARAKSTMTVMSWWEVLWGVFRVSARVFGKCVRLLIVMIVAFFASVFWRR